MRRAERKGLSTLKRTRRQRATASDQSASAQTFTRPTYCWRRLHDGNIIAEVATVPGMGSWRIYAYYVNGRASEPVHVGRAFSLLTDAHLAADVMIQRDFNHECRIGVCGRWLRWREEETDDT